MKKALMAVMFSGTIALVGQQLLDNKGKTLQLSSIKLVNEVIAENNHSIENHEGGGWGGWRGGGEGGGWRGGRGGGREGGYRGYREGGYRGGGERGGFIRF